MFVRTVAVGVAVAGVASNVADGVVGVGVVVGTGGAVGGATGVAGEGGEQPVQPIVLEALLLATVAAIGQAGDIAPSTSSGQALLS